MIITESSERIVTVHIAPDGWIHIRSMWLVTGESSANVRSVTLNPQEQVALTGFLIATIAKFEGKA